MTAEGKKKKGETILIIFPSGGGEKEKHHYIPMPHMEYGGGEKMSYMPASSYGSSMSYGADTSSYASMEGADSNIKSSMMGDGEFASSGNIPIAVPFPVHRFHRPIRMMHHHPVMMHHQPRPRQQSSGNNGVRVINLNDEGSTEQENQNPDHPTILTL